MEALAPLTTEPPTDSLAPARAPWLEGGAFKAALILLAGLFIYSPVFHGGWLWDDNFELTQNSVIQDPGGLKNIWQGNAGADFLPLKSTLQWIIWHTYGADPTPFHLVSIGFHLLNALLLWRLFYRLGMRHGWLGGLLFTVHPIFVESVSWVSELKNTMSLAALLPAMLAWVSFDARGRRRDYWLSLGWFVVALLCKSSVVMWPVVILLYAWWRRGRIDRGDLRSSLPFFAVSLLASVTTFLLQKDRAIGAETFPLGGLPSRIALAGLDLVFYLGKTLLPVGQLPMYPQWHVNPPSAVQFLPWPVLIALAAWLWLNHRTSWGRALIFGLGFFVITLFPVLGFFTMSFMRIAWVSDHLVYLPSIGIIGLATAGLGAWYDRLGGWQRSGLVAAGWLVLTLTIYDSQRYAGAYSNLENMCRYTIQGNPDAWLAHQLLGVILIERRDVDGAFEQASLAVQQKPDVVETQNTIANALEMRGDLDGAIVHLKEGARLAPNVMAVYINLARCLARTGRFDEAAQAYSFLLQRAPRNPVFLCNAGVCLFKIGQLDDAIARFRDALSIDPNLKDAQDSLAVALKQRSGDTGAFQQNAPAPP